MTRDDTLPALVIGAGLSGLGVARALADSGIACRVLEAEARPGSPWRARHPQLRLNTRRTLSALPGRALPREAGAFPHRDTIADYLEAYADTLPVPIAYGVRVARIARDGGAWRVDTDAGVMRARNVVVATGRDRVPFVPRWPGAEAWAGRIVHAHDLGPVARYRGRRVLVVGVGNSGMDALNHLVGAATASLSVSVREGPTIFPKRLLGFPVQQLAPILARLPVPVLDRLLSGMQRLVFGDLRRIGLPRPATGGATRLVQGGIAPAIDDGAVAAMKDGRIAVLPAIARFTPDAVHLADGRTIRPDVLIAATGYRSGLDAMLDGLDVLDERGFPRISGPEQIDEAPGLFFAGMKPGLAGFFHEAGHAGRAIARAIALRERRAVLQTDARVAVSEAREAA
ncbi:flavin-containing monooxygenase [Salinarimonas rosea]|uniref:flavin-containing monooxygenase n=1 Tax=Salinarimonas rosea TaxID=552063 RepID=UPI000428CAD4|nr:NAD(P)/FAD-dependent oxidoreductase [Salinarimonas rosea]